MLRGHRGQLSRDAEMCTEMPLDLACQGFRETGIPHGHRFGTEPFSAVLGDRLQWRVGKPAGPHFPMARVVFPAQAILVEMPFL